MLRSSRPLVHDRLAADEVVSVNVREQAGPGNARHELVRAALAQAWRAGAGGPGKTGIEGNFTLQSTLLALGLQGSAETHEIEPELRRLRRSKDDDELKLIRASIHAIEAAYAAARLAIRPRRQRA
jgi:Xaa-Pro aminopeptidase